MQVTVKHGALTRTEPEIKTLGDLQRLSDKLHLDFSEFEDLEIIMTIQPGGILAEVLHGVSKITGTYKAADQIRGL